MIRWKRLFYYLLINVAVSTCTILLVLTIWERTHPLLGESGMFVRSLPSSTAPPVVATFIAGSVEPSITPTQPLTIYQVQAGDTLGDIALQFGVPVNEIMKLNGIENADSLGAGMVLFIPVMPTETPQEAQATEEPASAGETLTPSPANVEPQVFIVNIFGAGDLATERVRFERRGERDLSLASWQLRDEDGNIYTFPQLTLYPGGAVDLYSRVGIDDVAALYWGLDQPIWEAGEIVTLVNEQGNIQATFTVP